MFKKIIKKTYPILITAFVSFLLTVLFGPKNLQLDLTTIFIKMKNNYQIVVGFSSLTIALCALIFSIYQGYQTRKHNRLSCRPLLSIISNTDHINGTYWLDLLNTGLGPAIIEEYSITMENKAVQTDALEPIKNALQKFLSIKEAKFNAFIMPSYCTLPAKENITLFKIECVNRPFPEIEHVNKKFKNLNINITYYSFYGEKFSFKMSPLSKNED